MPDDNVPVEKAVQDLLSDVRKGKSWWSSSGSTEAITGRMENGVRVITYTFDAKEPAHDYRSYVADVAALNRNQKEAAEHILSEIEKVANVKFRLVAHVDRVDKSDIRFFQGRILLPDFNKGTGGGYAENRNDLRDVIINNNANMGSFAFGKQEYGILAHEILHTLGLSHPGGSGSNPLYTQDSTVMSYNPGQLLIEGPGPFDVVALQYLYGKPVKQPPQRTVNTEELLKSSVLYSAAPITLEFNKSPHDREAFGEVYMELASSRFARQITGVVNGPAVTGGGAYLGVRLAPGTQVKDVLSGPESRIELHVTGNELPNILQGGARNDTLTPRGGNDVLTGGKGKDTIVLTPHSGRNNRVTDFNPMEDSLKILGAGRVELRGGPEGKSTDVLIKDNVNTVIASVVLANDHEVIKPEDVRFVIEKLIEKPRTTPEAPKPIPPMPKTRSHLPGTPMGQKFHR